MGIFKYINKNKDLTFKQLPFTNVDNIIFCMISYNPFEKINNNKYITINTFYEEIKKLDYPTKRDYFFSNEYKVLETISNTKRYKDIIITNNMYVEDTSIETSFAAITFKLPINTYIVTFRGSNTSVITWKENFNMFYLDMIPSGAMAIEYLNNTKSNLFSKIIVTGHSKGGNLAVLASINSKIGIRYKLAKIYNNDGPGFIENIFTSSKYKVLESKIITLLPKYSIVGRIFNCTSNYKVVSTRKRLFEAHLLINWDIDVNSNDFVYVDSLDKNSVKLDKALLDWSNKITKEERKVLIDIIYKAILNSNKLSFSIFNKDFAKNSIELLKMYKGISKEDKKTLIKALSDLFASIKEIR